MKRLKSIGMIFIIILLSVNSGCKEKKTTPAKITIPKEVLLDKIKGGWAGQTIGVTYGGPTEFKYNSRMIHDSIKIPWPETGYCKWWFDNEPGIFDDIYMDLTFVKIFEKDGIDAPVDSFALAFSNAPYPLWHANQAARYNILHGTMPPESGFWKNNPHSDDIDFQIEADHLGLMSPGMPVAAAQLADKIGHIMNFGDGWYGGVYVSAMYSLAFLSSDVNFIVKEGLKMIPQESDFYKFMNDVIVLCGENQDWKQTWQVIETKWGNDLTCPDGYSSPFNIEAKMNCAYVIMGLLYGNGDFFKTMDISTRCGADSDCNPSTAAGILGTALGYSNIEAKYLNNVKEVEDIIFPYTELSLNDTYKLSYKHAMEVLKRNGGKETKDNIVLFSQNPVPVRFEKSFDGVAPIKKERINQLLAETNFKYQFEGTGILISGRVGNQNQFSVGEKNPDNYVAEIEVIIDGTDAGELKMPADFHSRKHDVYWNFDLSQGHHEIELKLKNPSKPNTVRISYVIVYSNTN